MFLLAPNVGNGIPGFAQRPKPEIANHKIEQPKLGDYTVSTNGRVRFLCGAGEEVDQRPTLPIQSESHCDFFANPWQDKWEEVLAPSTLRAMDDRFSGHQKQSGGGDLQQASK